MSTHTVETNREYIRQDGKIKLVVSQAWSVGHGYWTNAFVWRVMLQTSWTIGDHTEFGWVEVSSGRYHSVDSEVKAFRTARNRGRLAYRQAKAEFANFLGGNHVH